MNCLTFIKINFVNIFDETCNKNMYASIQTVLYNFVLHVQLNVFVSQLLIGVVITKTI